METFTPRTDILPLAQQQLWPELRPVKTLGYVLYGGTAVALRLGHRQSVDFDFFTSHPVDRGELRQHLPFLREAEVTQENGNTFEVITASGVKVSFFGGLDFERTGEPQETTDGVLLVASLPDLMAMKVILQRSAAKDYQDIAAMVRAGVRVDLGLAAAEQMIKPTFPPSELLKALVYFEGGDMRRLSPEDRAVLKAAAAAVKSLPVVELKPRLTLGETAWVTCCPIDPGFEMEAGAFLLEFSKVTLAHNVARQAHDLRRLVRINRTSWGDDQGLSE